MFETHTHTAYNNYFAYILIYLAIFNNNYYFYCKFFSLFLHFSLLVFSIAFIGCMLVRVFVFVCVRAGVCVSANLRICEARVCVFYLNTEHSSYVSVRIAGLYVCVRV